MLLLDIVEQVFRFDKVVTFEALPLILSVLAWKRKNILKMHYFARFQSARALDQGGSCNIFALVHCKALWAFVSSMKVYLR